MASLPSIRPFGPGKINANADSRSSPVGWALHMGPTPLSNIQGKSAAEQHTTRQAQKRNQQSDHTPRKRHKYRGFPSPIFPFSPRQHTTPPKSPTHSHRLLFDLNHALLLYPRRSRLGRYLAVGCVTDSYPNSRTLNAGYSTANTIGTCLTYCAGQGTHYAGLENGNQCFCGPSLDFDAYVTQGADGLTLSNNGGCTTPCAGNSTQNCGGSNRLLIFESSVFPVPTHATVDGFDYQGCFPDHVNQRLLPTFVSSSDSSLTTAKCLHACAARGYDLAGLEYSTQCLCGSSSSVTLSDTAGPTNCEYSCSGARAEVCGGASFLDIYKATSNNGNVPKTIQNVQTAMGTYDYQGCYTDRSDSQGRALQTYSSSGSQTVENCVASCAAGNYIYAAAEYGSECRCGNRLASFSKNTPTCDMPCSGASGELCGGQNYAMSLYKLE